MALIPKQGTGRWSRRQAMCSRTLRKLTQLTQNTRSLRKYFTQILRNNYANKITQILRKCLHFTQIDYADITQILVLSYYADITQTNYAVITHFTHSYANKLRRYYANKLRNVYAFYADITQMNYAILRK